MRRFLRYLLIASVVVVLCLAVDMVCRNVATYIRPREKTTTAMGESAVRTEIYLQNAKKLPTSLEELPRREGYLNRTTDAWERPLIFTIENGGFELKSLGKDGAPGGVGEDEDIVKRYRVDNGTVEEVYP